MTKPDSHKISAKEFNEAYKKLKAEAKPTTTCWKCGKAVYEFPAHPSNYAYLEQIGFDDSCCFEFPKDSPNDQT